MNRFSLVWKLFKKLLYAYVHFFGNLQNIFQEKDLTGEAKYVIVSLPRYGSFFFAPFFRRGYLTLRYGRSGVFSHIRSGFAGIEGGLNFSVNREVLLMRVKITLACTECKQRNYDTVKNKKNDPDRLEMNKYCRFCRKHTLHRETK